MAHAVQHSIIPEYVPRSTSHDGRFGRIFGKLPPWVPPGDDEADQIARIKAFAAKKMFLPLTQDEPPPANTNLPVGYTYFGQFIDHDITFDPSSSLTRQNDPDGLKNFRSPRLDLDSLYGRGPDDQPYMYQRGRADGATGFLLTGVGENGKEPDLPRIRSTDPTIKKAVALIGDPRNDENIIVSQLQLAFIQLHNTVLERIIAKEGPGGKAGHSAQFREAQRIVRWFYQYLVWNDFVKRLVPDPIWNSALTPSDSGDGFKLGLKDVYNWKFNPYIPVEFSVAAYRFGHSLIRAGYQVNFPKQQKLNDPLGPIGTHHELPIFDPTKSGKPDLRGGSLLPDMHTIEWDWYFSMGSPADQFPQDSNLIDTKLSRAVFNIPGGTDDPNPLAALNIQRGWRFDLPAGTAVARAMGFKPMTLDDPMEDSLWVYILKEAETQQNGERLGDVGGTIVAAVFAGLLKGDPLSYVQQFPKWTPAEEEHLASGPRRPRPRTPETHDLSTWDIRDLLAIANMPINPAQVNAAIAGQPLPPLPVPASPPPAAPAPAEMQPASPP